MSSPSLVLAGALALLLGAGCSYTRTVARGPVGAELWIEDEGPFLLEEEPVEVEVPLTWGAPAYRLFLGEDDEEPAAAGALARTELEPLTAAGLLTCAGATAPACMSAGFCLANPSAFLILLAPCGEVLLMSGINAIATSLARPTWSTVPVVMGCALLGLFPLAGLPLALRVPDEIGLPEAPAEAPAALALPAEVPF